MEGMKQFVSENPVLQQKELQRFQEERVEQQQAWQNDFTHREEVTREGYMAPVLQQQPVVQQMEPTIVETQSKKQKSIVKARQKRMKELQKTVPYATEYTHDIIGDKSDMSYVEGEKKELLREKCDFAHTTREWEQSNALLAFAPEVEISKHKMTSDSRAEQEEYVQKVLTQKQSLIEQVKRDFIATRPSVGMFTPEYVGSHAKEVMKTLQKMQAFCLLFKKGSEEYEQLSPRDKMLVEEMTEMSRLSELAFKSALVKNGLCDNGLEIDQFAILKNKSDQPDDSYERLQEFMEKKAEREEKWSEDEAQRVISEECLLNQEEEQAEYQRIHDQEGNKELPLLRLNQQRQYTVVQHIDAIMKGNPEEYAEKKEQYDRMLKEQISLLESHALCLNRLAVTQKLLASSERPLDAEVRIKIEQNALLLNQKATILWERVEMIEQSFAKMFVHQSLEQREMEILAQIGVVSVDYEKLKTKTMQDASLYVGIMKDKKEIYERTVRKFHPLDAENYLQGSIARAVMLMRAEKTEEDIKHNEKVIIAITDQYVYEDLKVQVAKQGYNDEQAVNAVEKQRQIASTEIMELVQEKYEEIMSFDTYRLENISPDRLIEMQEELTLLDSSIMMIADLSKRSNTPVPNSEQTIDSALKEKLDTYALKYKMNVIKSAAVMSRQYALLKMVKMGVTSPDTLLDTEKGANGEVIPEEVAEKIVRKIVEMKKLRTFAEKELPDNTKDMMQGDKRLERNENIHMEYHANLNQTVRAISEYCREHSAEQKGLNGRTACIQMYKQNMNRIKELKELLAKNPETQQEEKDAIQKEIEAKNKENIYLEIQYKLTLNQYRITGEPQSLREPLFRSYVSSDSLACFRDMNDEEYFSMMHKLAAGAFLDEQSPQEEIQKAKEQNIEAMQQYKERIRNHYEMMYRKYGTEVPASAKFRRLHYDDYMRDAANIQVDNHFVENFPQIIDMTKEEDARIYHLVRFYNIYMGVTLVLYGTAVQSEQDYNDMKETMFNQIADSVAYVREHGGER